MILEQVLVSCDKPGCSASAPEGSAGWGVVGGADFCPVHVTPADVDQLHGSVAGYRAGCRGVAGCVPSAMGTCSEAWIAYRGDFAIARMVDAGMSPAAIVEAERERRSGPRPAPKAAPAPRVREGMSRSEAGRLGGRARSRSTSQHGTPARYKAGCQDSSCPASPTCQEAAREHRAAMRRERLSRPVLAHAHGSDWGYQRGCHKGAPCPSTPSCYEVHKSTQAEYRANRREADRG